MDNQERVACGAYASMVGTPDFAENDSRENVIDTIANMLHFLAATHPEYDARAVVDSALQHFIEERTAEPVYVTHDNGVVEVLDADAYRAIAPDAIVATCGHCGRSWDDNVISAVTPAPSARCPFEYDHEYDDEN